MEQLRIKVKTEQQSEEIQYKLFELGYDWGLSLGGSHTPKNLNCKFLFTNKVGIITWGRERYEWMPHSGRSITQEELNLM